MEWARPCSCATIEISYELSLILFYLFKNFNRWAALGNWAFWDFFVTIVCIHDTHIDCNNEILPFERWCLLHTMEEGAMKHSVSQATELNTQETCYFEHDAAVFLLFFFYFSFVEQKQCTGYLWTTRYPMS